MKSFPTQVEADLAKSLLESCGIASTIISKGGDSRYSGLVNPATTFEILVDEDRADEAEALLKTKPDPKLKAVKHGEFDKDTNLCGQCGSESMRLITFFDGIKKPFSAVILILTVSSFFYDWLGTGNFVIICAGSVGILAGSIISTLLSKKTWRCRSCGATFVFD